MMGADVSDSLAPKELILRNAATVSLPATAKTGTIMYNSTLNKLVVWTGAAWTAVH